MDSVEESAMMMVRMAARETPHRFNPAMGLEEASCVLCGQATGYVAHEEFDKAANSAEALDRATNLLGSWATEQNEHAVAGEHGIAEGLNIAIESLREAVHGRQTKTPEPSPRPSEGWAWPMAAGKAHYFREGHSLCNRWMFLPKEFDGDKDSKPTKDDCVACRRILDKE